jgi:hypothetical protein
VARVRKIGIFSPYIAKYTPEGFKPLKRLLLPIGFHQEEEEN